MAEGKGGVRAAEQKDDVRRATSEDADDERALSRVGESRRRRCEQTTIRLDHIAGTSASPPPHPSLTPSLTFHTATLRRGSATSSSQRDTEKREREAEREEAMAVPGLEALYRHLPSSIYKFNVRLAL
jgi:hypothetical protein